MSHTPGPWRIGAGGKDDGRRNLNPLHSITVFEVQTNHHNGYWSSIWSLTPQDARLIAAAPDLLEMVKELYGCIEDYSFTRPLLEKAEALIAKATGVDAGNSGT